MIDGEILLPGCVFLQTWWKSWICTSPHQLLCVRSLARISVTCRTQLRRGPLCPPSVSLTLVYVSVPAASHLPTPVSVPPACLRFLLLHTLASSFLSGVLTPWEPPWVSLPPPLPHLFAVPVTFFPFMLSLPTCLPPGVSPWASPSCCPWSLSH